MVKEHKLHAAVKSNILSNVLKVLEKYNKQKFRTSSTKCKKVDFNQRDNLGLTVIHHAARNGSLEILETLLIHGSCYDVFDCHGLRPIGYACAEGHLKIVDYLLRWGSCANRVSAVEYLTPLHLAAMYGYVEIVHLLLRYKADPFVYNRDNKTPLDLACAYGKYNVINLLFSFTTSLTNTNIQCTNNLVSEGYGARTPQSDHVSRSNKFNQVSMPNTPKVERYFTRRSSSPYESTNSSSGGSSNYNTCGTKNRVLQNISYADDNDNGPFLCPKSIPHSSNHQQKDTAESELSSTSRDICIPPTLDNDTAADIPNDLRQNLREACFAVQAKALIPFGFDQDDMKTISFEIGDLITVLKQYHNGVMKGFVTSEGISSTGLFPSNYVELINDHRPPVCCDKPIENSMYQSPEKTPIPNRGRSSKVRPTHLDLNDTNNKTCNEDDVEKDQDSGSPIIIPPQMVNIRTNASNSTLKWSTGTDTFSRCTCVKRSLNNHPSPDLPSVSINDFPYGLSLGQGLISAISGPNNNNNKRNSIISMDSGRGSATDSKSVVSGITPASVTCNKPLSKPLLCCKTKEHIDNENPQCRCCACTILPPTVPPSYHQSEDPSIQFNETPYRTVVNPEFDLAFTQKMSTERFFSPCSMISLDETQYSSGSSDRGIEDVMVNWLNSVGLGAYGDILSNAGYDLATLTKATPEDLNASGITNPKDRQFMKTQLNRLSVYDGLPETMPSTIHDFLDGLKLLQYEDLLLKQNFSKIEHLLGLTWEDLADIGIEKLGHQKKLSLAMERLSRLVQFKGHTNNIHQNLTLSSKLNFDSVKKPTFVPQSHSFEELPYPAVIMAEHESRDNIQKSRNKFVVKSISSKPNVVENSNGLLSKSDESVSSVMESSFLGHSITTYNRHDDISVSSSTSSCSQESGGQEGVRPAHTTVQSSASNFAHENIGTVRIKRPLQPPSQDSSTEPSYMQEYCISTNSLQVPVD